MKKKQSKIEKDLKERQKGEKMIEKEEIKIE